MAMLPRLVRCASAWFRARPSDTSCRPGRLRRNVALRCAYLGRGSFLRLAWIRALPGRVNLGRNARANRVERSSYESLPLPRNPRSMSTTQVRLSKSLPRFCVTATPSVSRRRS